MGTTLWRCGTALALCGASAFAQSTFRVNVDPRGLQADGESRLGSRTRAISDDGRYVAFESDAANLVAADTNGSRDVFVHDRWTGVTELVSVSSTGTQANTHSSFPSISGDGRYVSFQSRASNLVPGVFPGFQRIYVRDRVAGTTEHVSVPYPGTVAWGNSAFAYLSSDGRWVAFVSGVQLTSTKPSNMLVYVRDRVAGQTYLVSASSAGVPATIVGRQWISANGRYVTFGSQDAKLVPGDTNNASDAFLWDSVTSTTVRVSLGTGGVEAPEHTWEAEVSDDGRHVAFASTSSLVPGTAPGVYNTYLHDRQTLQTVLLSRDENGLPATEFSFPTWISPDGRYVALSTTAPLLSADMNGTYDMYLHDTTTGTNRLIGVSSVGQNGSSYTWLGTFTPDLRFHVFSGVSDNLVPGDTNGLNDVFVRDLGLRTRQVAYCTAKVNSQGCAPAIGISGVPSATFPDPLFVTASGVLNRQPGLFAWSLAPGAAGFGGGTLCVARPAVRAAAGLSGGSAAGADCSGAYSFHFDPASAGLAAGTTVYAQFLSRDPGSTPGLGLTDAVRFTLTP